MLLTQLIFGILSIQQLFYVYYTKEKPQFFEAVVFICLSEERLPPENCLAICHSRASCL